MISICCTRFDNETWKQHERWILNNNYNGCIYNTPVKIKERIPLLSDILVIEMNNSINEIMGIGYIKNYVYTENYIKIYDDGNYNRYTYKGNFHIDKSMFMSDELIYIKKMEELLFKGKRHSKRGQGIQLIPKWIHDEIHIRECLKQMFKKRFSNNITIE